MKSSKTGDDREKQRGEDKENQNREVKVKEVFKRGGRENGKWKQQEEEKESERRVKIGMMDN